MHDWRHEHGHEHGHEHRHEHIPHGEIIDSSEWRPRYRIDYSLHGDNLDRFVLKVREELERIYHLLRRLRRLDASAGDLADTVPYQLHVDTASGRLLIRDAKNEKWLELGKLDEDFFGITPEDIGAVRNAGIGAFYSGIAIDRPKTANINDIFYSLDEKKIYFYSGTSWEVLASLDFADLYGYEEIFDKETGKADIDITGSPDKILGYPIEVTDLKSGDVLTFDAAKGKIINVAKDEITTADISETGAAGKIVRLDSDGIIHADVDGKFSTARQIAIKGDATGNAYFDGSEDVTINLSVSTALSATNDGIGNNISETYATKAGLSSFVTKDELATTLSDYAPISALSDTEKIIAEDILKLFSGGSSTIIGGDSSMWTSFTLASEDDISALFSEEA